VDIQIGKFINNGIELVNKFYSEKYEIPKGITAFEESKKRIKFFKHIIEDCDGYKNLYQNGERISTEKDLQRLFKFVWHNTKFKVNFEANNGRGPADAIVSFGAKNQCIIEFKLASNSKLKNVFEQTEVYKKANQADDSIIVIFYFSEEELQKVNRIINEKGHVNRIDDDIILIDCREDNKQSGSKV